MPLHTFLQEAFCPLSLYEFSVLLRHTSGYRALFIMPNLLLLRIEECCERKRGKKKGAKIGLEVSVTLRFVPQTTV